MGQIPDDQRPHRMRLGRQLAHVMPPAGFVVDLGDHHDRNAAVDGVQNSFGLDGFQRVVTAQRPAQPLRHIKVGGEIAGVGQDHPPLGVHLQARRQRLIDLDRQRIAHHHMARLGPDQLGHPVAHAGGHVHPSGAVPAADQHFTPLARYHLRHLRSRRYRQRTQRVTVEINHALGQMKLRLSGGKVGGHQVLLLRQG